MGIGVVEGMAGIGGGMLGDGSGCGGFAFALVPNSARVFCWTGKLGRVIADKRVVFFFFHLEDLDADGVHGYHERNQGVGDRRLGIQNGTCCLWRGFLRQESSFRSDWDIKYFSNLQCQEEFEELLCSNTGIRH